MPTCCRISARTCARSIFSAASANGARAGAACRLVAARRTTVAESAEKTDLAQRAAAKRESLTVDTSAISAISARDRFFWVPRASERLQREQFIDLTLTVRKCIHPHSDA